MIADEAENEIGNVIKAFKGDLKPKFQSGWNMKTEIEWQTIL